ncbi:MAG: hypothetical protein UX87_C0003G0021 [Candidatus Amesbacteria bacterium GW2011_GWA1_47_16]|uniref:Uncharacterized protein n=5 Tax=Candidatus Amesiibacteriota TaxID=1752730 RepID=A0A1F4ZX25_9BACT|nr:MAG: hypothetical protein UX86_C0015G0021 [Candidatus Amesbacteria bacterium GW2011_GWC1_47_15]KKU64880.1 MAG: hypothetical protein UX87_C0003G0021 [Candidatus Amesbacteria bacterium GW2011_GWA1_47_16]KKU97842.1 MAG: hypothetical protein UY28_C0012G0006 [Candidatus Amesbacteria bacterium GW2011_GWB1_48_13]OGC99847.1 MAG: hypothetical protein A2701_02830 [Candidatus Amesbacteria bacterium RIFCSPHIGHO2_01_FULL_47_34]OGD00069.1 MAG: hypothetical protein A2972_00970 [Candidatus Amesbacteria bact
MSLELLDLALKNHATKEATMLALKAAQHYNGILLDINPDGKEGSDWETVLKWSIPALIGAAAVGTAMGTLEKLKARRRQEENKMHERHKVLAQDEKMTRIQETTKAKKISNGDLGYRFILQALDVNEQQLKDNPSWRQIIFLFMDYTQDFGRSAKHREVFEAALADMKSQLRECNWHHTSPEPHDVDDALRAQMPDKGIRAHGLINKGEALERIIKEEEKKKKQRAEAERDARRAAQSLQSIEVIGREYNRTNQFYEDNERKRAEEEAQRHQGDGGIEITHRTLRQQLLGDRFRRGR